MAKDPKVEDKKDEKPAEGTEGDVKPLDDEAPKGFGAKKLLMIVIPVLILGVAAALYFLGVFSKHTPPARC